MNDPTTTDNELVDGLGALGLLFGVATVAGLIIANWPQQ